MQPFSCFLLAPHPAPFPLPSAGGADAWCCEAAFLRSGDSSSFVTRAAFGSEPRWEEFRSVSVVASPNSKLLVKIFPADLASGRPAGLPLGTGVVSISTVVDSKGLFDAWVPLQGATQGSSVGEVHVVMLFTATRKAGDQGSILNPVPAHMTHTVSGRGGGGQRYGGIATRRPAADETAPDHGVWAAREQAEEAQRGWGESKSSSNLAAPSSLQDVWGGYLVSSAHASTGPAESGGRGVGENRTTNGGGENSAARTAAAGDEEKVK